jgi:chemotaxis protein methyltransferase CheR
LCRISISRFHRDRGVFDHLRRVVLPELPRRAWGRGEGAFRCWSAGCASGEEPYTLMILWQLGLPEGSPANR